MKLDTLEVTKDSFVDEELKERFSDLVYRVDLKEEGSVFVYLLFEHKGYSKPDIGLHLLSYMVRLWLRRLKQEKTLPLPAILPLVIYHGESGWNVPVGFHSLVSVPEAMKPLTPDFRYLFWDLSAYTDDEIKGGVSIIEEGVQKGIEKGMVRDARKMVLEAISSRFNKVPEGIVRSDNAHLKSAASFTMFFSLLPGLNAGSSVHSNSGKTRQ